MADPAIPPPELGELRDREMVDRTGRSARPHEPFRVLLPRCHHVVERVVRGVGGGDEDVVVLGDTGEQGRVGEADGRVVEGDAADHRGAGGQDRVRPTVHGRELAEADRPARAGDVDDLGVVRRPRQPHRLLGFAGEAVPAAACPGRSDESEVLREIPGRRGGPDRIGRRRADRGDRDDPVGDLAEQAPGDAGFRGGCARVGAPWWARAAG